MAAQARRTRSAEQGVVAARRTLVERETAHRAVCDAERQRLEGGEAQVADLAVGATWLEGALGTEHALREQVQEAEGRLQTQRDAEAAARRELAERRAEARVVERHRDAWVAVIDRKAELESEEEANDAWTAAQARQRRGRP